ncbi:MAG: transglycosylase domain-containing protein, partial [Phenylobacterium sp.]
MTDESQEPQTGAPDEGPGEDDGVFRADLKARPRRKWLKWVWLSVLALAIVTAAGGAGGWIYIKRTYLADLPDIPEKEALYRSKRAPGIRFLDRTGALIAERGPRFGDRVALGELPPHVVRAFLAAEDQRFYEHGALDYRGLARAAWINWRAGGVVQGGS